MFVIIYTEICTYYGATATFVLLGFCAKLLPLHLGMY